MHVTVQLPNVDSHNCRAFNSILARVADKWTVLIVVVLGHGPRRFNEIKRIVGRISQLMLMPYELGMTDIWPAPTVTPTLQ
jgi:DNA-binding HxlR family transcriptional regulator